MLARVWTGFGFEIFLDPDSKILEQERFRQLKMWLQPPLSSTRAPNLE